MTQFDKREEAFENAAAFEEELRFKAVARRNRYLGLWAAEQLGLDESSAKEYAQGLVESQVGKNDDKALARDIADALNTKRPELSEHRILRKIGELTTLAMREIVTKG